MNSLNLNNYFELFGLPQRYCIDRAQLDAAFRDVAARVHPDKFANAADADRRAAMQWSTAVNEGYHALKSPIKRAEHLLKLAGHAVNAHTNTAMPREFLIQQMQWREALEEARAARDEARLDELHALVMKSYTTKTQQLEQLLDTAIDHSAATATVRELMFIDKFKEEVANTLDSMSI
ncbi:MAG: Fe-S protein assembly co-chaperone HscB [Burkholderiaceae bacterium]